MAGDPSPLHGEGWLSSWKIEEEDDRRALLRFDHAPGEWPWSYEARQEFALDETGYSLRLSCRNTSDGPMPCGLGQHPYFPCRAETRIDTKVTDAWTIDEHVLPVEKVPAKGRYDLANRLACGQDLDNGFGGWSGEARMTDPDWPFRVRLPHPMPGSSNSIRRKMAAFSSPNQSLTQMRRSMRPNSNGTILASACLSRVTR